MGQRNLFLNNLLNPKTDTNGEDTEEVKEEVNEDIYVSPRASTKNKIGSNNKKVEEVLQEGVLSSLKKTSRASRGEIKLTKEQTTNGN